MQRAHGLEFCRDIPLASQPDMRVVIATFGTRGDVSPFFRLAQALEARGHESFTITDAAHADALEQFNLRGETPFALYDPQILLEDPRYSNPSTGPYHVFRDVFMPLVPKMFASVQAALRTPTDLVLVHPWCFGAHYAATEAGVPAGTVCLAPLTWWSADDPGLYSDVAFPRWIRSWLLRGPIRWLINLAFGRPVNDERRKLGLEPQREAFYALLRTGLNYGLWPDRLRGPADDDPHAASIVGFDAPSHANEALSDDLQSFLQKGTAPVVMGLGSLLPPLAPELYERTRAAARSLGRRAVLVGAPLELADEHTCVVERAPYPALFARAEVVVHHGGINSLNEALRSGRPQLVIPFATDQFDNGRLVEHLGVARSIPRSRATETRLKSALDALLESKEMNERARHVADELAAAPDGTARVAEDIERRFEQGMLGGE